VKERTNKERRKKALLALRPYDDKRTRERTAMAIVDLLTDLFHLADKKRIDMDQAWKLAGKHHEAERAEEQNQ
jgi:hypothetical protein